MKVFGNLSFLIVINLFFSTSAISQEIANKRTLENTLEFISKTLSSQGVFGYKGFYIRYPTYEQSLLDCNESIFYFEQSRTEDFSTISGHLKSEVDLISLDKIR